MSILFEVKPLTGKPCAGDPPARFGGRGGLTGPSYPYRQDVQVSPIHDRLFRDFDPVRVVLSKTAVLPAASHPENRPTMTSRRWPLLALVAGFLIASGMPAESDEKAAVPADHAARMLEGLALFKAKVRPALIKHCLNCHGGKTTKAGLDLSDRDGLVAADVLEGGGKASRLIALIRHTDEPHMPQKAAKLPDETITAIARWIDCGAPYDQPLAPRPAVAAKRKALPAEQERLFWSFRGLRHTVIPPTRDEAWARTPIDRFVLAALEHRGIEPNPPADRRTFIRRVCFDLTGLPPSPDLIDAFLADPRPTPMNDSSIASWPLRHMASVMRDTGSTWPGSPSPTATNMITIGRLPIITAIF